MYVYITMIVPMKMAEQIQITKYLAKKNFYNIFFSKI